MSDTAALGDRKRAAVALLEAGHSVAQIAGQTGDSVATLYLWQRHWRAGGLDRVLNRPEQHDHTPLGEQEQQVLDGLMLGDGSLALGRNSRNPCLHISRTGSDAEYLRWTAEVFSRRLTARSLHRRDVHDARTGKSYDSARLRTRCDAAFLPVYERWYGSGEKAVPADLSLSAVAVAVWLADDGSVTKASRRSPELKFATHGFTEADVRRLTALLTVRYKEPFRVYEESGTGQFTIRAFGPAAKALLRDVDPHFPPLDRKSDRWRKTELLDDRQPTPPCPRCDSTQVYRWARSSKGVQQFKCMSCMRGFRESYERRGRDPHATLEGQA